jgi:hypothetical protein
MEEEKMFVLTDPPKRVILVSLSSFYLFPYPDDLHTPPAFSIFLENYWCEYLSVSSCNVLSILNTSVYCSE